MRLGKAVVGNEGVFTQKRLFYCVQSLFWAKFGVRDEGFVFQERFHCVSLNVLSIAFAVTEDTRRMECIFTSTDDVNTTFIVLW